MEDRLTYKNNDKYYLRWGVDQELINLSPETQELIRAAIEKLVKYEDLEEEGAIRTASAEWQILENERDYWGDIARRCSTENRELKQYIFDLRNDFDIEIVVDPADANNYTKAVLRGIRERLSEKKPKGPTKNWIFNRFGQR